MSRIRVNQAQRTRFERQMWPWIPTVLRFARLLTGSEHAAEDLAQETMMQAFRKIDRFEDGTDARAWLLTIQRHLHLDQVRVLKNRPMASLEAIDAVEPEAVDAADPGEGDSSWEEPEDLLQRFSDQELIDGLKRLPDEMRWTLLLTDVEGLDHSAAAEVLGVAPGTVKSRTHRARRLLRDHLFPIAADRGWLTNARQSASEVPGRSEVYLGERRSP